MLGISATLSNKLQWAVLAVLVTLVVYLLMSKNILHIGDLDVGFSSGSERNIDYQENNEGLEVNDADKVFISNSECVEGDIRPFYNVLINKTNKSRSNQAAICACFKQAERGHGWYCWN